MKTEEYGVAEMTLGALLKPDIVEPLRDAPCIINMGFSLQGLARGQTSLCLGLLELVEMIKGKTNYWYQ